MSFQIKKQEKEKPARERISETPPEKRLRTWFPELTEDTHKLLDIYREELLRFNKAINLISVSSVARVETIHFADSILAGKLIYPALHPNQEVFDFGSGNGFPGVAMAIMYPDFHFTLVERDSRKIEFLKHTISKTDLKNVVTLTTSIEDLEEASCYNVVTRGFAALHRCMLMARKPMAKGGKLFHLKGDSFASELAGVPSQLFSHWNASLLGDYKLPDTNSVETIVLTEKISE